MPVTYKKIASVTVTAATAANVEFLSIPNTFTDLKIVFSARNSTGDVDNVITLNTSTGVSSARRLYGTGSSVASDTAAGGGLATPSSATGSTFSSTEYYFPNYTGTANKSVSIDAVNETNGTNAYSNLSTQLFTLGSAITSIKIAPNSGLYVTYTTAVLYGISKS